MESIAKSDIFFVITTIAVVVVTAAVLTILFSLYRIVRDMQSVSDKIAKGGEAIASDISDMREGIKAAIAKVFSGRGKKKEKAKKKEEKKI